MKTYSLTMTLNGQEVTLEIKPSDLLAYVLRDKLGLTGTKIGCDEGECGACTVILDGQAVDSCLLPAMKADGCEVVTVEGLAKGGELDPLQQAFIDKGAVQCGYCTPGLLMSARALLDENPHPSEQEVKDAIAGNLCRCTGYLKIVEAIKEAAR
jgi:aerobic-type carbon monoxide dehydrogenase small subunit (CoxS/CutS family)